MISKSRRNTKRKIRPYSELPLEDIPGLWHEAVSIESIAPDCLRGGYARARTALLAGVPKWELPAFLDQLQETIV